jgi:hypothetical protein
MYAIDQSKLRESKTFTSLRNLQKVFSSNGLVKISASWFLVLIQAGRSGLPEILGRAFRVFNISGFQHLNPNSNPKFQIPVISGTRNFGFGYGYPQTTRYYQTFTKQHT